MINKIFAVATAIFIIFGASTVSAVEPSGAMTLLIAKDKTRIYASYYRAMNNNSRIALLFHQAGSNRMEYEPLLSTMHIAGFDTLTIDQRSGDTRWGVDNMTVKRLGESAEYIDAYADLEAALEYAIKRKYKTIVVVGSSYSASLSIVLASKNPDEISAVAAFSPGEYFTDKNWIKTSAEKLRVPLYVTGASNERQRVEEVLVKTAGNDVTYYRPINSVHGASTCRQDMNPDGYKENLQDFSRFLDRFN
jgi:alpha-beta hydrolase superfamily lysophospholipase